MEMTMKIEIASLVAMILIGGVLSGPVSLNHKDNSVATRGSANEPLSKVDGNHYQALVRMKRSRLWPRRQTAVRNLGASPGQLDPSELSELAAKLKKFLVETQKSAKQTKSISQSITKLAQSVGLNSLILLGNKLSQSQKEEILEQLGESKLIPQGDLKQQQPQDQKNEAALQRTLKPVDKRRRVSNRMLRLKYNFD